MRKHKRKKIFAFIDSQNLNLGTSKDIYKGRKRIYKGWKLDFKKFRRYLSDKFRVTKAFLFIGYIAKNKKLYRRLKSDGYHLVFKPTVMDSQGKPKGNVDTELVVWTMRFVYEKVCDQAIIVSGDGDFAVLADFLLEKNRLLKFIVPNYKTMSILIKKVFIKKKKMNLLSSLNDDQEKLAIKNRFIVAVTGKHLVSRTGGILSLTT